ncbi:unnamed protein product [Prorocentrum cordatum]|uniref:Uncharacterized protein n=1 Tax=Prorocentrum cordatum TaxID=2364126 RepID=A0ABN9TWM9_9DINO|nr:unnamed protein product [Polarella glacialis]
MRRLSVASIFLRSCYSISIRPDVGDDYDPDVGCRDAAPGEWCHAVVMWAKEIGFEQRPGWLPGGAVPHRARELQALLHRHGEAGCPRPCPQDRAGRTPALSLLQLQSSAAQAMSSMSAAAQAQTMSSMSSAAQAMGSMSSAAQAVSSRSRAAQTMRMSSKARSTLGLNHALFQAVMERSLQPKALRESEARKRGCQDAEPGGLCYQAASWLHDRGLESHPTWFPSLSPDSTMQEVQSVLYTLGKATCPRPCQSKIATRRAQSDDDRVLEVDDSGRQVLSEAYELSEPTDCGNTVEGDWCYVSIMWLKDTGLDKHSDWYPTLTHQSSMEAFQTVLHNQGKVGCPLPCSSNSTAPELNEALVPSDPGAAVSDSALRYEAESAECEDAEEGSQCHKAISRVMDVGLWLHPEEYPELAADCTRQEIQEHLYLRRKYGCGRPCPEEKILRHHNEDLTVKARRRVKKSVEEMTVEELQMYLSHAWDGLVNADEYEEEKKEIEGAASKNAQPHIRARKGKHARGANSAATAAADDTSATPTTTSESVAKSRAPAEGIAAEKALEPAADDSAAVAEPRRSRPDARREEKAEADATVKEPALQFSTVAPAARAPSTAAELARAPERGGTAADADLAAEAKELWRPLGPGVEQSLLAGSGPREGLEASAEELRQPGGGGACGGGPHLG